MTEKPEDHPDERAAEKTLELSDLPAFNEGENVKGGVYSTSLPSVAPDPVCTTHLLTTCNVNYSDVDTWCRIKECGIGPR